MQLKIPWVLLNSQLISHILCNLISVTESLTDKPNRGMHKSTQLPDINFLSSNLTDLTLKVRVRVVLYNKYCLPQLTSLSPKGSFLLSHSLKWKQGTPTRIHLRYISCWIMLIYFFYKSLTYQKMLTTSTSIQKNQTEHRNKILSPKNPCDHMKLQYTKQTACFKTL